MLKKASNRYLDWHRIFFIVLIIFLSFLRLLWLDRFPAGMSHDETEYSVNGLAYRYMGKDLSGFALPLSIFRTQTEGRISIIPALIISFYSIFTNVNELSLRLLYWSVGIFASLIFYKVVKLLFEKKIAQYSLVVFLINPWTFDLFRWIDNTSWALLFTLLGTLLFFCRCRHNTYLSLVFFGLAFLSYHAVKILFIPLISVLFVYKYLILKDKGKKYLIFLILSILFFVSYIILEYKLPGEPASGRLNDLVIFNKEILSDATNLERRLSIDSAFRNVFSNKFSSAYNIMIRKYFAAFSLGTLLFSGDIRSTYTFGEHGLFYLLDLVFLIFGTIKAFKNYKKQLLLVALLIFISPMATSVSLVEASVFNRSFLLIPSFIILIGVGISAVIDIKKNVVKYFLLVIYAVSVINFTYFYFFRYPVTQQENHYFSEKLLSQYLNKINGNVTIYAAENRSLALNYIFYLKDKRENAISNFFEIYQLNQDSINIGNATFTNKCETVGGKINIYQRKMDCGEFDIKNAEVIQDQKDSGGIFYIYNDDLCNNLTLTTYRRDHRIEDYNLLGMQDKLFCERWINKI